MNTRFNYFKLPNAVLENSLNTSSLKVISYLYSLMYHRKSAKVKIRQITIAERCSLSVATVKRCISTLEVKGFIIHKSRSVKRNGYLGTYTYTLLPVGSKYFTVERKAFNMLQGKSYMLYLLMSKLKVTDKNCEIPTESFFHSLSDLSELTGYKRSEIMQLIKILCNKMMIWKSRRITRYGDHSENHYFVSCSSHKISITHSERFVKYFFKKIIEKTQQLQRTAKKLHIRQENSKPSFIFPYIRGGGRIELSILYDPLSISFRRKNKKIFLDKLLI